MHLRQTLLACAVGILVAAPAPAADPPMVVVQVQSIDELLSRVKAAAKGMLPERLYNDFEKQVLPNLDPKKLSGVDSKRPSGFFANIDAGILAGDFSKSQAVLLVPVSGEKEFLGLIAKGGIQATEQKDAGLYALEVPNVPLPVFLRFNQQYACVSVGSSAAVDPKAMPAPRELFPDQEKAALSTRISIERLPKQVKDAIVESVEGAAAMFGMGAGPLPPAAQNAFEQYMKFAVRIYKDGLEGGRDLTYRLDLDAKEGLVAESVLTAKPESRLARSIAGIKPSSNRFAPLASADSAAHGFFSLPLYVPELKQMFADLVDVGAKEAQANLERDQEPKEVQTLFAETFNALKRTINDGTLDLGASLRGPGKGGKFAAVGAVTLKDTAQIEKAVKEAVKLAPKQAADVIKLDAHKVGERSVHEFVVADMLPKEVQAVFGKASVFVCFGGDAVVIAFGESAQGLVKEALDSRSGPAPMMGAEIAGKRMAELIKLAAGKEKFDAADPESGMWLALLTRQERMKLFSLSVEGGEQLKMRVNYGIMPLMAFGWVFTGRSAEFRQVQPPVAIPAKP